jgi:hypothetical protein
MHPFRIALASGTLLVVVLCLLRLFPLALIAAAVVVPFLFILYLFDVDLYEEEPLPVLGFTVAWGLLGGIAVGLLAKHLASQVSLVQGKPDTHDVVWLGVVLPSIAFVAMIAGPLVLLPYRNFNDVLDGVTFGGSSAVTLVAAEAITNSSGFLGHGFRAAGQSSLWIARLLTLGVALPLLAAGVAGATCGCFWLQVRGRARDRRELRLLGSPFLVVPVAVGALVGSYLSAIYLGQWAALALTAGLAAVALLWLRFMIHVGLCEEAAEHPVGPPIECPNCHRQTPAHSFCGRCGVSLRALPKRGARSARMGLKLKLAIFFAFSGGALGLAAVVILVTRPAQTKPPCQSGIPCAGPPQGITVPAPNAIAASVYEEGKGWTSDLGVTVHYPDNWQTVSSAKRSLVVKAEGGNGLFVAVGILVYPASMDAVSALADQVATERQDFLGLQRDTSQKDVVLSPEIGFARGISEMYRATVDQPPSPDEQVEIAFEAATHGGATVVVEAITNDQADSSSASSPFPALEAADEMLDSFQWSTS